MNYRTDILSKLERLRDLHPDAYQQVTMPGCGFSALPSYALEDDTSEWWSSEAASTLCNDITDAILDALQSGKDGSE